MVGATLLLAVFAALASGVSQPSSRGPAIDVRQLLIDTPETILRLDTKTLRGTPTRLAWSPDGRELYLRLSTFDRWANETVSHAVVSPAERQVRPVPAEPAWAARYWSWKSGPAAPGREDFAIKLEAREELLRTTNVPREGNIGQHTADPSAGLDEVALRAALASQKTAIETLTVRGHIIDQALNRHVVPGRRFGWAPAPHARLAFVSDKGRLMLMDETGRTREIKKTKDVSLPAWSEDGARLAFVQKSGRDTFALRTLQVRLP